MRANELGHLSRRFRCFALRNRGSECDGDWIVDEQKLEIIFVSSDRTAQEMAAYVTESHGDWLSLDYSARNVKDSLSQ